MKRIITGLILLLFFVAAKTPSSKVIHLGIAEEIEWKLFSDSICQIKYPSNWELDQSKQMGSSFILFSPLEGKDDNFKENVNLVIQPLNGTNLSLVDYAKISEGQIKRMMINAKILVSKRIEVNGTNAHQILYTADMGIYHLKFLQYYFTRDNKAFVLTFTATQTTYDNYSNTADKILQSFKFQ